MSGNEETWMRSQIAEMLRKAPAKVLNGSVQVARDFKKFYGDTVKQMAKARLSKTEILSTYSKTVDWYK